MAEPPSFEAYRAALALHKDHPVGFEMPILHLTMLLSALQLSLRHPNFPPRIRPYVEGFLAGAIENLERLDPALGQLFRAGNDPTQDVEV